MLHYDKKFLAIGINILQKCLIFDYSLNFLLEMKALLSQKTVQLLLFHYVK